jgi:phosphoenolpyruvate synthase/pyruvate phosphate dikinase
MKQNKYLSPFLPLSLVEFNGIKYYTTIHKNYFIQEKDGITLQSYNSKVIKLLSLPMEGYSEEYNQNIYYTKTWSTSCFIFVPTAIRISSTYHPVYTCKIPQDNYIWGLPIRLKEDYYSMDKGTIVYGYQHYVNSHKIKVAQTVNNKIIKTFNIPIHKLDFLWDRTCIPLEMFNGFKPHGIHTQIEIKKFIAGIPMGYQSPINKYASNLSHTNYYIYNINNYYATHAASVSNESTIIKTVKETYSEKKKSYGFFFTINPDTLQKNLTGYVSNYRNWLSDDNKLFPISDNIKSAINKLADLKDNIEYMFSYNKGVVKILSTDRITLDKINQLYNDIKSNTCTEDYILEAIEHIDTDELKLQDRIESTSYVIDAMDASGGIAKGKCIYIEDVKENDKDYILICNMTLPEHVDIMKRASGIVIKHGSPTCHAAIIAKQFKIPCVIYKELSIESMENKEIVIDGYTGKIYTEVDKVKIVSDKTKETIVEYIKENSTKLIVPKLPINIFANADTLEQIKIAQQYNALGIGLYRTEHSMLGDRVKSVNDFINSNKYTNLGKFREYLTTDIQNIRANYHDPIIFRLLDAPLHEFCKESREENPMLGYRGVRVLHNNSTRIITHCYPYYNTVEYTKTNIMLPMVNSVEEVSYIIDVLRNNFSRFNLRNIVVMLETPSACFLTEKIARMGIEKFSFGTNDLTQTTLAISRDDFNSFQDSYGHLNNPFKTLHPTVLELMRIAVDGAKKVRNNNYFCICGEQGQDIDSVLKAHEYGINAISINPYKIPEVAIKLYQHFKGGK